VLVELPRKLKDADLTIIADLTNITLHMTKYRSVTQRKQSEGYDLCEHPTCSRGRPEKVVDMFMLPTGQQNNPVSIWGREKRLFSSPKCPDRLGLSAKRFMHGNHWYFSRG